VGAHASPMPSELQAPRQVQEQAQAPEEQDENDVLAQILGAEEQDDSAQTQLEEAFGAAEQVEAMRRQMHEYSTKLARVEEQREAAEAEAHRVQDKYSRIKHKYMRQTHIQAEVNKVLLSLEHDAAGCSVSDVSSITSSVEQLSHSILAPWLQQQQEHTKPSSTDRAAAARQCERAEQQDTDGDTTLSYTPYGDADNSGTYQSEGTADESADERMVDIPFRVTVSTRAPKEKRFSRSRVLDAVTNTSRHSKTSSSKASKKPPSSSMRRSSTTSSRSAASNVPHHKGSHRGHEQKSERRRSAGRSRQAQPMTTGRS